MADVYFDAGNPFYGRLAGAPGFGQLGTQNDPYVTNAQLVTALIAGNRVLMHALSVIRFGSGTGERSYAANPMITWTGIPNGGTVGVYADDVYASNPQIDSMVYDNRDPNPWVYHPEINNGVWQKTFSTSNFNSAGTPFIFAGVKCGDLKANAYMLSQKIALADVVNVHDAFCSGGAPAVVTINTGGSTQAYNPSNFYNGLAISTNDVVGVNTLQLYSNNNITINDLMICGGGTSFTALATENLAGVNLNRMKFMCNRGGGTLYFTTGAANAFLRDVYAKNCVFDTKYRSGAGQGGQGIPSTNVGDHNGFIVDANCKNINLVDPTFLSGYRHNAISVNPIATRSVDNTWPRGVSVYGTNKTRPALVECVPTEYGHGIGCVANGGWYVANLKVTGQCGGSQLSGRGIIDNISFVSNTRDPNPSLSSLNVGSDCGIFCYENNSGAAEAQYSLQDITIQNCYFENVTNYALGVQQAAGSAVGPAGAVKLRNCTIIDLSPLVKLWPATGSSGNIPAFTAGPNTSIFTYDGGQAAGTSGLLEDYRNNVFIGTRQPYAVKGAGTFTTYTSYNINDAGAGTNVLNNTQYATQALAGISETSGIPLNTNAFGGVRAVYLKYDFDAKGLQRRYPPMPGAFEAPY